MSGAIKTVVKVAGIAAVIALAIPSGGTSLAVAAGAGLGLSAAASTAIAMGLAVGSSMLAGRAKAPATSDASKDRLLVDINPNAPRTFAFGTTAMATDIRDQEFSANQEQLHRFVVTSSHRIKRIREIWFEDKLAWSESGGVQSEYLGYLGVECYADGNPANAKYISPRMGYSRRFTGCSWVYLRYKLTGNSKKAESPFASNIPTRVTIVGDGAYVYDPRLDSTVPGGSGPCRANDQSTWVWNEDAARNPALQLLWYLLGWRIQNPSTGEWRLAVGKGIPARFIDLPSFITAANMCDEPVTLASGGTQPRYRSDGLFSEGDPTSTVTDQLKAAMNAELDDVDGRLRLTVLHNDLGTPVVDLTTDDVIGRFKWEQTPDLDQMRNVVRGTYVDPSSSSLYQSLDYPEVRIASPDGIDRIDQVNFQAVQDARQAQRLVKQRIARAGYAGTFTATFSHRAWRARKGDPIRLTFAPRGWTNKLFRVADTAVQVDGQVPMVLVEEHPDIYLWDADERPAIQPVQPTSYDPYLNPLVQAVSNPQYADGTPIDSLRPAEPGATVGASPSERDKIDAIDAATIAGKAAMDDAEARIAILEGTIGDGDVDLSDIIGRILAAEGDIETAENTLIAHDARITDAKTVADTAAGTLATFSAEVEAAGAKATSAMQAVDILTGQQATISDTAETARSWASDALTATSTMAGDVATIKAQAKAGGGNLLANSEFAAARVDGWGFGTYDGINAAGSVNGAGEGWQPTGENVLSIWQPDAGAGFAQWATIANVEAGKWYEVQVRTGMHRCSGTLYLIYQDAAGVDIPGSGGSYTMDPAYPGGTSLGSWGTAAVKGLAPAGAVRAWIALRKWATSPGYSDSWAFFCRPQLAETLAASATPLPYAPSGAGASVTQAFTALSDLTTQFAQVTIDADTANTNAGIALSAIESFEGDISLLYARAAIGVTVGVDGVSRWTGMEINGTTVGGGVNIHADLFRVTKPGTGQHTEYSDGNWRAYDSTGQIRSQWGVWA